MWKLIEPAYNDILPSNFHMHSPKSIAISCHTKLGNGDGNFSGSQCLDFISLADMKNCLAYGSHHFFPVEHLFNWIEIFIKSFKEDCISIRIVGRRDARGSIYKLLLKHDCLSLYSQLVVVCPSITDWINFWITEEEAQYSSLIEPIQARTTCERGLRRPWKSKALFHEKVYILVHSGQWSD